MTELRDWWSRHHAKLLSLAIVFMLLTSVLRLGTESYRLLWEPGENGAVDLRQRHEEVHLWFAGRPLYAEVGHAVYPPASYVLLWPLLGWLTLEPARWLWAITSVLMLGWFAYLFVRESTAETWLERLFLVLLFLSMYATSITIGNGQLIVHILPTLIAGLFFLRRNEGWWQDILGAGLIVLALVSPTITAPFFWVVLFVPGRIRPAVLVVVGYVVLTLFALWVQDATPMSPASPVISQSPISPMTPIQAWAKRSQDGVTWGAVSGGYANLSSWMAAYGLQAWSRYASLLALAVLGAWVYFHRHVSLWLLLGVSAIAARTWVYHRVYDDLLILLPLIALFRVAKQGPAAKGDTVIAGLLLAITWVAMLAPARVLTFPPPWSVLFATGQTVVWLALLIFLLWQARREKFAYMTAVYSPSRV